MADPLKPVGPPAEDEKPQSLAGRVFWFAGLALAGLIVVASASYALRMLLFLN